METTKSTPITGLAQTTTRLKEDDLFLVSKKDGDEFNSRKMVYSTLSSSISADILPLVPKASFPIYDTDIPLISKRGDMAYSNNAVTQFYDDTQVKIQNLNNVKLDKTTTTAQAVVSKVSFNSMIQCPTSNGKDVKDVVNVDYLNKHVTRTPPFIIDFWCNNNGCGWYKLYSNGFLEQGGYSQSDIVQLFKAYKNAYYTISLTRNVSGCGDSYKSVGIEGVYNTYFDIKVGCSNHPYVWWETKGMALGY